MDNNSGLEKATDSGAIVTRQIRGCIVVNSSGCHRYGYWNEQSLFDGKITTGWCTPSRKQARTEFLEINLGKNAEPELIRLLSRSINPDAGFPGLIKVFVPSESTWSPVAEIKTKKNTVDLWHSYPIPKLQTDRIRLEFEEIGVRPEGKYFLQFMCLELHETREL